MIADRFKLGHDLLLARWLLDDQPEVPVRNNAAPQAGGAGGQETQAARPALDGRARGDVWALL